MVGAQFAAKKFLKVYLNRGFIGLPQAIREHAKCLGLRRRYQTVYLKPSPIVIGNILKIKELVKVDLVDEVPKPITDPMHRAGFTVTDSYLRPARQLDNV